MDMKGPLRNLTPERWELVKSVLCGNETQGVSLSHAAKVAGVTVGEIRAWVKQSRSRDPLDDPFIWEIAEVYDERRDSQGQVLEDEMWRRVFAGTVTPIFHQGDQIGEKITYDNNLLMKALQVKDKEYVPNNTLSLKHVDIDAQSLHQRLVAENRLALAKNEEESMIEDAKIDE